MSEKKGFWAENRLYLIIWAAASLFLAVYLLPPFNADLINYDSAYQYWLTRNSLEKIWQLIPTDYSPPLYAILLKFWTMAFGETLAAMRAFALVPLCGMLFLAAFPIRRAFGGKASVLCTVFFSFSSVNFIIVPEIRPATLAYFLVTAAAIYSYLALFNDSRYAYVCFTVFSVLAMYTHNVGMLAALSFYICAFFTALARRKFRCAVKFVISGAISAVCYIPWLVVVIQQFSNVQDHYWSSGLSSVRQLYDWTIGVNFAGFLSGVIIPAAAMIAIISALCSRRVREKLMQLRSLSDFRRAAAARFREPAAKTVYVILMYVTPIIALLLFALLVHPIIVPRYFYIFCGTGLLMIAAGFSQLSGKAGIAVLSALTVVSFTISAVDLGREIKASDFPEMLEYIRESAPEQDIAFLHAHEWTLGIMMYYFPEAKHYISDDTWCVLTTFDAFPAEVVNIGKYEDISEYESGVFLFEDTFVNESRTVSSVFTESGKYSVEEIGFYSEPYSMKQKWRLLYVTSVDQDVS